ncbi:MAG: hypothetical protein MZU91_02655 [Desulfosudis oleivorans]|nr:hypothetical protein [Desulfosudis oleivorans]
MIFRFSRKQGGQETEHGPGAHAYERPREDGPDVGCTCPAGKEGQCRYQDEYCQNPFHMSPSLVLPRSRRASHLS